MLAQVGNIGGGGGYAPLHEVVVLSKSTFSFPVAVGYAIRTSDSAWSADPRWRRVRKCDVCFWWFYGVLVVFRDIRSNYVPHYIFPVVLIYMFVRSRFSPWNTDIALGAAKKKFLTVLDSENPTAEARNLNL